MKNDFTGLPDVNNDEVLSECTELIKILTNNHYLSNINGNIENVDDVIKLLVNEVKSHHYIGVGVGGLFIKCIKKQKEYALLYKRYKEPEKDMFSIIGGSGSLYQNIEISLKNKFVFYLGVQYDEVMVKDIICVNNHMVKDNFHYLSPSYYVDVKNIDSYLYWETSKKKSSKDKTNGQKKVAVVTDINELRDLYAEETSKEKPLLAWVSLELIEKNDNSKYFSFTTRQAVEKHMKTKKKNNDILEKIKIIINQ